MVINYPIRWFFWFSALIIFHSCHLENFSSSFTSITVHYKCWFEAETHGLLDKLWYCLLLIGQALPSDLRANQRNHSGVGRFNSTASGESLCKTCDETCLTLLQGAANRVQSISSLWVSGGSCTVEDLMLLHRLFHHDEKKIQAEKHWTHLYFILLYQRNHSEYQEKTWCCPDGTPQICFSYEGKMEMIWKEGNF